VSASAAEATREISHALVPLLSPSSACRSFPSPSRAPSAAIKSHLHPTSQNPALIDVIPNLSQRALSAHRNRNHPSSIADSTNNFKAAHCDPSVLARFGRRPRYNTLDPFQSAPCPLKQPLDSLERNQTLSAPHHRRPPLGSASSHPHQQLPTTLRTSKNKSSRCSSESSSPFGASWRSSPW
jgi:hypothetical protein